MTKAQIHADILRIQSEQIALYPDIPAEYYSIYRQHKPREPAHLHPEQNKPEQTDIFYRFGKGISKLIKRITPR